MRLQKLPDGRDQITVVLNVANQMGPNLVLQFVQRFKIQLSAQVVCERFTLGERGFQRRQFVIASSGTATVGVASELVDLLDILLPVDFVLIFRFLLLLAGRFKGFSVGRGFRRVGGVLGIVFFGGIGVDVHAFLQDWILLEGLIDQFLQFGAGKLEQFDRLLKLRGHDELLGQLHLQLHVHSHGDADWGDFKGLSAISCTLCKELAEDGTLLAI